MEYGIDFRDLLAMTMGFFRSESMTVQVFAVVLSTLFAAYIARRVLHGLHHQLKKTSTPWDDAFFDALGRPLTMLILLVGLLFAADIVRSYGEAFIFNALDPLREVGIIAIVAWFFVRFIKRGEKVLLAERLEKGEGLDRTTVDAVAKLLRLSVIITASLVALQTLGFSVSGVLAAGGVGGLAIGFAAKDLLANFFGGAMIYMDRPFAVGDWIRSPDRNIEGTVEAIGWRLTRIRTFDKRPLYVPNSTFASIAVENPSRMSNRRIYEAFGIRYDDADKMADIVSDVKSMLKIHPEIDLSQTLIVNFNECRDSALEFFVYTFTKTTDWVRYHEIKQDVLLKILDIIAENDAECAFPTSTLHLPKPTPEFAGLLEPSLDQISERSAG